MNSFVQLSGLLISFIYGILLYYAFVFNIKICNNIGLLFKIIISVLFINNCSLLYIFVFYKLTSGVVHLYFILSLLLGFYFIYVNKRK